MGLGLLQLPDDLEKRRQCWTFDDFEGYVDAVIWTKGVTGTGTTVTNPDAANGILNLGNAATTANAEAWVATTRKNWLVKAGTNLLFEARINAQEANVNNLSLFAGFSDSFATGLMTNGNPNTPNVNMSAAGIFLPAGATSYSVITSVGTTQLVTATAELAVPSGDQILRVEVKVVGTSMEVDFLIGNADVMGGADSIAPVGFQQARETASGFLKPIKHRLAFSGINKMGAGVFAKQGSTTPETLRVDYIGALNLRA
jgi:hypothetical protein